MKTLTVKQPWASLIVEGIKDIENRTWKCPQKYIGERVLIHASAKPIPGLPCKALTPLQYATVISAGKLDALIGPNGAIIGSVEIVDCVINHPSIWAEKSETNCSEKCRSKNCEHHIDWDCGEGWCSSCKLIGQSYEVCEVPKDCPYGVKINTIYNWVLANPIKFDKPIPCKGRLSFWESEIEACHICGKPTTKHYECAICNEFYCDDCAARYNKFTQIDYNCCSSCAESHG